MDRTASSTINTIRVRRAKRSDIALLAEIQGAAVRRGCTACYRAETLSAWSACLTPARYRKAMADYTFMIAEDVVDARALGFSAWRHRFERACTELAALYVHPDNGKHGVGRRLLLAMEHSAQINGSSRIELDATFNAAPFYARHGYHVLHHHWCREPEEDVAVKVIRMARPLPNDGVMAACTAG
ncbi:GNAT family N-acetyltransferase [Marichromatium bheemlicum]|uniref:GNAT family N-acetyltransferase n=1 Tax=Marichromatium bheemlicum TaxID=365339 RepID=A0ABX1IDN9_9GAMM|nr:GNAT family N-acetyltransferase [Marichromatium bheemlicum]NKN34290.1 GNAT family N-acetyltransferase [Marichromatium bheemlicum]